MKLKLDALCKGTPKGCFAFPLGKEITLSLSATGATAEKAYIYIGNDEKVLLEREVPVSARKNGFYAEFKTDFSDIKKEDGLFFFHFEFIVSGKRYYTECTEKGYSAANEFVNEEQILIYDEKYSSPDWIFGKSMYQIFPDRFARGGKAEKRKDAIYREEWDDGIPEYPEKTGQSYPNNTHFGGTLYGVAEHIDYLEKLNIKCIYLNPVFDAYSNHKYDTGNFLEVDRTFGGDKALKTLIGAAHKKNMKVILDGVFNHVGDDSIYFNRYGKYKSVGACQSKESAYYKWFDFRSYPDDYASWWGIKNLPRVNRCESYRKFITEKVIPKYMEMGIDGWRLDVADELEDGFLDEICRAIKKYKKDALIIGEVWEDASDKIAYGRRKRYFRGSQLDSVTNYPFRNAVIEFVKNKDAFFLVDTVKTLYRHYPPHKLACLMNFLGSHDTERITTVLNGDPDDGLSNKELSVKKMNKEQREKAISMLKNAYLLLACLPGVPCIYYGDEIGMEGYHDPFNRRPFPVSGFSDGLSDYFAKINALRKKEPLFRSFGVDAYSEKEGTAVIKRFSEDENGHELTVVANMSDSVYEFVLNKPAIDIMDNTVYNNIIDVANNSIKVLKTFKNNE